VEYEDLKAAKSRVKDVQLLLDRLQASIMLMPIKEKMAKMQEQKQLKAKIEELGNEQNERAPVIEPLQEWTLQTNMEVVVSHSEVKKILEINTERIGDHISAQSIEEVLEQAQRTKSLTL